VSAPTERVTPGLLRAWPLPQPSGSKNSRGTVLVVGGSRRSPGAVQLAGRAALRVGAGKITLAVAASVATAVSVAVPECGVVPLEETRAGHVRGTSVRAARDDIEAADAALVGPGLSDAAETRRMLEHLVPVWSKHTTVVLDAFALGALAGRPQLARRGSHGRPRILTPNESEAARLLGREVRDLGDATLRIARDYRAVVSCFGRIASPDGRLFTVGDGSPGLGTSGSGDALAGAIAGLAARGCPPLQAAVWGTYLHAAAGESLSASIGPLGFLASEIVDRFPAEITAIG